MNEFAEFDQLIADGRAALGLATPILPTPEFSALPTALGLFFPDHSDHPVYVTLDFGFHIALSSVCELKTIVYHELAHIALRRQTILVAKRLSRLERLIGWPLGRPVARCVKAIDVHIKRHRLRQSEFNADQVSMNNAGRLCFATALLKINALAIAMESLLEDGTILGSPIYSPEDGSEIKIESGGLEIEPWEATLAVGHTFYKDRATFDRCCLEFVRTDSQSKRHPSSLDRMARSGIALEEIQDACDFSPESLIDFELFRRWTARGQAELEALD